MATQDGVSRRSFLTGSVAGLAAAAVGGSLLFGPGEAVAEQVIGHGGSLGNEASDYADIYANGTMYLPVRKAECPGPHGTVAFENRDIAESEIKRTDECEVLVLGAGVAGLMASLKAADLGANVITLEKMNEPRGCFECFGAVNAKCQKGTKIDKTELIDEILRSAYWRTTPEPTLTYVNRSGEATDFWQEMLDKGENGFVITKVAQDPQVVAMPAKTGIIDTELGFYDSPSLPKDASVRSGLSGIYVVKEMAAIAKSAYNNLDLRVSTPAVQLEVDNNGTCIGCIAKDDQGYFRVSASKGVIVCTGGYDANPAMMQAFTRPEDYASSSWWNPCYGTTGDGHMMGLKIGAKMDSVPQPVMNFRWGNPDSFYDSRTWNAIYYGIMVNPAGKRFVNEDLPFQAVSNAQNAQPGYGKGCYEIFDETMMDGMNDDATIKEFKDKGWLFEGDSPQALASQIGMDGEQLAKTIETYNKYMANGKDEDFGRNAQMTLPFTGKKYYALTTNSNVLATVGGLTINGDCNVVDENDEVIPHLYAAGNASGNFFAGNYPRHIPGTSIGRAVTFGYVAAENAVKGA